MENILDDFISYLFKIGLLSKETVNDLKSTYQNIIKTNKDNSYKEEVFKDDMTNALIYFFNNLNNDKLKLISLNVILKFIENHKEKQKDKLKSAILLSSRIKHNGINSCFNRWNKNIDMKTFIKDIVSCKHPNLKRHHTQSNHCGLETSVDKREREDYEQCTFHPITNTNRSKGYQLNYSKNEGNITQTNDTMHRSVYERLYSDKDKYKLRKELLALQIDNSQSANAPFTPKLIDTPTKSRYKPDALFYDRQKSFASSKSKNRDRIKERMDYEINQNLTFSPHINKSFCTVKTEGNNHTSYYSNTPTYIRLYDDNIKRNRRSPLHNNNKAIKDSNNPIKNVKKAVDYRKIEQLYSSYKAKKMYLNRIQKEMEEEQGITFKPLIQSKDSLYYQKVDTSFQERNEKLLQNKKRLADIYNQAEIQQIKERQVGYKQYTKEEKDIISKKIIERLYKPEYTDKHFEYKKITKYTIPTENISSSHNKKECQGKQRTNLDSNIIEGLPSTDMIKTQSNDIEEYEKLIEINKIFNDNKPQYNEAVKDNDYFNNQIKDTDKDKEEEELIGKYNDKIISINEYTFCKNKKREKESEIKLRELNGIIQSQPETNQPDNNNNNVFNPFKEETYEDNS